MHILLIEDDEHYSMLVARTLSRHKHLPFKLTRVETLEEGLRRLDRERFDVVLVDLNLPDADGIESIERVTLARSRVPAIVLSNNSDEELAIRVIQAGAQDYLVKGQEGLNTLHRTIRYSIERKAAEFRLKQLASYDSLTNLANRQELYHQLEKACAHADRHGDMVALFLFDLDKFKRVNDCHGHHAGDALLRAFAQELEGSIRMGDTASRLGGDEFAVVLEGIPDPAAAMAWSKKVMKNLEQDFEFEGNLFSMSASIGGALYPAHGRDVDTLLKNADLAMYEVKNSGRKDVAIFDPKMGQQIIRRKKLESDIRAALDAGEFEPVFQPKISLETYEVEGFEAYCRWRRADGVVVRPDEFLPIAQANNLMPEIGRQVRRGVFGALTRWSREPGINLPVSVNLDAQELAIEGFWQHVLNDLAEANLPASSLRVEITESVLVEKALPCLDNLKQLHEQGVGIELDGFGAGHTSLYYLRQFWIDALKLDRALVGKLGEDQDGLVILRNVFHTARELGIDIIGKGIETAGQLRRLREMKCTGGQGFLIARPMNLSDVADWLNGPANRLPTRLGRFASTKNGSGHGGALSPGA